jgi:hypothetical protein
MRITRPSKCWILGIVASGIVVAFVTRLSDSRARNLSRLSEEQVKAFALRGKGFDEVLSVMGEPYDIFVTEVESSVVTEWMYKNVATTDNALPRYIFINFRDGKVEFVLFKQN